ncbi:hypothetical protein IG631_24308 [Alternaria alternata]|nr:hypothetical protein IG631_24308 [Alternaria alternata]
MARSSNATTAISPQHSDTRATTEPTLFFHSRNSAYSHAWVSDPTRRQPTMLATSHSSVLLTGRHDLLRHTPDKV